MRRKAEVRVLHQVENRILLVDNPPCPDSSSFVFAGVIFQCVLELNKESYTGESHLENLFLERKR